MCQSEDWADKKTNFLMLVPAPHPLHHDFPFSALEIQANGEILIISALSYISLKLDFLLGDKMAIMTL